MIERQCALWPPHYLVTGPFGMKIWNETDPVNGTTLAWKIGAWEDRAETTIWMDGRPHPSENAVHERGGFTTGVWRGDTLTTFTTHIKAGNLRRNGAPNSDQEAMTTHYIRHGDLLTVVAMIEDPIYLTETEVISKNFQLDTANQIQPGRAPVRCRIRRHCRQRGRSAFSARSEPFHRRTDDGVPHSAVGRAWRSGNDVP